MRWALLGVVKGSLAGRFVEIEIIEKVIHDLAIVEANLGKLTSADGHDLVDMAFLTGVGVIHRPVLRVFRSRSWDDFGAA